MHRIRNFTELARTPAHRDALDILEAGFDAIDTVAAVRRKVQLVGDTLIIASHEYNLHSYRRVHVLGFGKAANQAALELERILGTRIHSGIIISAAPAIFRTLTSYTASHPLPSSENVQHSKVLLAYCDEQVAGDDLVLIIISGGGSAMLCWPASELEQGTRLYAAATRAGLTIHELNTTRKHLSSLKGGGLVAHLHSATIAGLIFSDVPGNTPDLVASGPTYPDSTTLADAQEIINRYALGPFVLTETPKDNAIFARTTNSVIVSNIEALGAMVQTAQRLGYAAKNIAPDLYDEPAKLVARFLKQSRHHSVLVGGGETRLAVSVKNGTGGRNQFLALLAAAHLRNGQIFASIASDGLDNDDSAGAIVDADAVARAASAGFDTSHALRQFDTHPTLAAINDLIFTGATGSNVSDLMLLLTE